MGSIKGGCLQNVVVKCISPKTDSTMTGSAVTVNSSAFDLRVATQTSQKFTYAKAVLVGYKTGTAGAATIQLTVTSGATSTPTTAFVPITTAGTDAGHGYVSASDTQTFVVTSDIDLTSSLCLEFLRVTATLTGVSADHVFHTIVLLLSGTREAPAVNTTMLTTA